MWTPMDNPKGGVSGFVHCDADTADINGFLD